jgi:C1A family cysteine protease
MKKIISAVLCTALLIGAASAGLCARAGRSPEVYSCVYSNDGYSYRIFDTQGNDVTDALGSSHTAGSGSKKAGSKSRSSLPSSYSSRDAGVLPEVKDQGRAGCCWAFAALTALEADAVSKGYMARNEKSFSPSHLTWFTHTLPVSEDDPHYGEGLFAASPYMTGGNYVFAGSTLSEWSGIADRNDYPYFPSYISLMSNLPESGRYDRGSGFIVDDISVLKDTESIKMWIMEHGVCTAALYYSTAYENSATCAYYVPSYAGVINHNVSIVGWNDNYPASNFLHTPPSDGAWLVMDSWGTSKHNGGFYWLSYANPDTTYTAGFALRESGNLYRNYSYNGAPYEQFLGFGTPEVSFANVFTADGCEKVSAVSFWSFGTADTVTVDVYAGVGSSSPVSGTPDSSEAVYNVPEGFHTVDLTVPVNVSPGDRFSVVISIQNSSAEAIFPIEGVYSEPEPDEPEPDEPEPEEPEPEEPEDGVCFTSAQGQSFAFNGVGWDDLGESYGNLYIQAYTECRHPYELVKVEPTCTLDGYSADICPQCSAEYSRVIIPAMGHSYGEWSDFKDDGSRYISRRYCSVCGDYEERSYSKGQNRLSLDRLLKMIFDRILAAFYALFEGR